MRAPPSTAASAPLPCPDPTVLHTRALWCRAPLDIANFALVPVRHQLLVANVGCFIESIMLSWIKANGVQLPGAH